MMDSINSHQYMYPSLVILQVYLVFLLLVNYVPSINLGGVNSRLPYVWHLRLGHLHVC